MKKKMTISLFCLGLLFFLGINTTVVSAETVSTKTEAGVTFIEGDKEKDKEKKVITTTDKINGNDWGTKGKQYAYLPKTGEELNKVLMFTGMIGLLLLLILYLFRKSVINKRNY